MITEKETTKSYSPPANNKELLLFSRQFAQEDPKKSWYYTLSTLSLMVLAFAATFLPIHWAGKLCFSLLAGLLVVRSFVIYHDYQHGAILNNSAAGKWLMTVFGIFVLAPTNIWKRTHDHHHHHNSKLSNSGIGSFPLLSKEGYRKLSNGGKFRYLASRHPLTITAGYLTLFILDFNVKSMIKSPKNHWDSFVALAVHFGIGYAIFSYGGAIALLLSWMLPFIIANGLGAYLFYAQHNFPSATFEEGLNWTYTNAALQSTSFLVLSPVMNWFTGQIGYHHVHHINHRIPFYRLKEAMEAMPELHHPKTTSLHPKEIWACLRLKIWDPEVGKMMPL